MRVEQEVIILYSITNKFLNEVKVEHILECQEEMLEYFESKYSDILEEIRDKKEISNDLDKKIREVLKSFTEDFVKRHSIG
jgi:F-type H+-transporting ATPase subunit alpha